MGDRLGQQFGNYRLVSLLGQGGYAEVYLGQHVRLNQQAAIKVLHAHLSELEAEHFQQEAQTIATLVHPGIVRVFDYDVQEGVPFLVIDYAPGGTLRRRYPKGSLVPLPGIISSVKQVADALQYAHEQKFIHRDIKPENMLLGRRQEVLLSDFGIATIAHSTSSLSTSAEGTSGTLAYMAPEQIEGHPRPASDQYALSVVVYEWLCGERPFEGSVSELIAQHLSMPPPSLHERVPAIPPEVEQVVRRALAKDPKARFASVIDFAVDLEQASQRALSPTGQLASEQSALSPAAEAGYETVAPDHPVLPKESTPSADLPVAALEPTVYPGSVALNGQDTRQSGATSETPPRGQLVAPSDAVVSPPLEPTMPVPRKTRRLSRTSTALLIGLVVVIIAGGILGSLSLLAHSGMFGAQSAARPYNARDVDFTWQLWRNPKFGASFTQGLNLISRADVSVDHLSITFHLTQAYAPFVTSLWVDGGFAPLPAHHFSTIAPEAILKSPDNLNPRVTSGPFMMEERVPGDHYTLMRNPRYYRANEGLPYLNKVVFRIVAQDAILKDLQAGIIDSAWLFDVSKLPEYQRLSNYTLVTPPTSNIYEAMYFNFHNTVLASHLEVRQAMAMAIDHQALINVARHGIATSLCTDHPSFYHPGYEPTAFCPVFDPVAANKLLEDNGWVKAADGVRVKDRQRLEFEYSTSLIYNPWRLVSEAILQRNFQAIGIKLDIQNYPRDEFFGSLLPGGKASPPTGAVAGRYDIAQFATSYGYDPDDSYVLACDQIPPKGQNNIDFYCNPKLDALYQQELATADQGVRQQLFRQIHQIYLMEFPFIVLFSWTEFAMVRKGTHNYQHSPIAGGIVNIWEWWCEGGKC